MIGNTLISLLYIARSEVAREIGSLGVVKRHGAVLGDAICLNSSLPCVLVDVVRCKMGKFSCCVPGCTNNWRNSPEKSFTLCRVMLKSGVCMKNSYGTRI